MILKAILLGLVAMLGHTNFLFGTNLLDRPLIMCTLTGPVSYTHLDVYKRQPIYQLLFRNSGR